MMLENMFQRPLPSSIDVTSTFEDMLKAAGVIVELTDYPVIEIFMAGDRTTTLEAYSFRFDELECAVETISNMKVDKFYLLSCVKYATDHEGGKNYIMRAAWLKVNNIKEEKQDEIN